VVFSYRTAIQMMTDAMTVNTNILCVPGMRDSFITDYAADRTKLYSMAIYLMDPINYDEDKNRLFVDDAAKPDVRETSEQFDSRAIDNNYSAMYFPDVWIRDNDNNKSVQVPPSIAAIGALAFNDHIAYPWFAPAGFNRGGLAHVQNVKVRLSAADRDTLYDARINPIATFPNAGFVIFGQKTLQQAKSALDRVNVRRMLLEVKRLVVGVANKILFEQNTPQTRARFIGMVQPLLALVQAQAGIEQFQVVMDDTNNSVEDIESNRLNGKIVLVPTRAVEFIAIDFIITNSGVSFE
jgi:phage tail sheath protein FI